MIAPSTPTQQKSTKPKVKTMTEQNTLSISELEQKANAGDANAQFNLAVCYAGDKLSIDFFIPEAPIFDITFITFPSYPLF